MELNGPPIDLHKKVYLTEDSTLCGDRVSNYEHTIVHIRATATQARVEVKFERFPITCFAILDKHYPKFSYSERATIRFLEKLFEERDISALLMFRRTYKIWKLLDKLIPADHWFRDEIQLSRTLTNMITRCDDK